MSLVHKITKLIPTRLWLDLRQWPIIRRYQTLSRYWQRQIQAYIQGQIPHYELQPKQDLAGRKVIWQYWGQGVDEADLPEIVRLCFASVDRHRGEYEIIRLSDAMIGDYIDLPEFVYQRMREQGGYNRTIFSDLLRTALLATYGGVWLDATILLTRPFDELYSQSEFFMFQRSEDEPDKLYWRASYYPYWGWDRRFSVRCLSSAMFAHEGSAFCRVLLDLFLHYWETQERVLDYFIYQILINELLNSGITGENCPIVSDVLPHVIHTKVNGGDYRAMGYAEAIDRCGIHKMTYFGPEAQRRLEEVLTQAGVMP